MRGLRFVGTVGAAGLLGGCALFFQAPSVEIVTVDIVALGLTSGTAEVVLDVTNEGRRQLDIRGFQYEVEVKGSQDGDPWTPLAEGFFRDEVSIPGRETRRVRIPVPFQYSALGAAVRSFLARGEVPYRVRGDLRVGGSGAGVRIPFRDQGVLKP